MSPALAGGFFTTEPPGKPQLVFTRGKRHCEMGKVGKGDQKVQTASYQINLSDIMCGTGNTVSILQYLL